MSASEYDYMYGTVKKYIGYAVDFDLDEETYINNWGKRTKRRVTAQVDKRKNWNFRKGDRVVLTLQNLYGTSEVVEVTSLDHVIHGTGYINYVTHDFGYIKSDTDGNVFFFTRNMDFEFEGPFGRLRNTRVRYDAVENTFTRNHHRSRLVSVRVSLEKSQLNETIESELSERDGLSIVGRHVGIIFNCHPGYFHVWSKSCGLVFVPKRNCDKYSANNAILGTWVSFICERQEEVNGCLWRGADVEQTSSRLQFLVEKDSRVDSHYRYMYCPIKKQYKQLCVVRCVGLMLGAKDDKHNIWNEQLGRVIAHKRNIIATWTEPLTVVFFDAKPILDMPSREIGWEATQVYDIPDTTPIPNWSSNEYVAKLGEIGYGYATLYNCDNYETIFTSSLDYYIPCHTSKRFNEQMNGYYSFKVLAVPSMIQFEHKSKRRAIYVEPIVDEIPPLNANSDGFGPVMEKKNYAMKHREKPKVADMLKSYVEKEEKSVGTDDVGIKELFRVIIDTSALFDLLKKHDRDLIQPMILFMMNFWDTEPEPSTGSSSTQQVIYSGNGKNQKTVETQTSICIEQELIDKMFDNDKLIEEWQKVHPRFVNKLSNCF